MSIKVKGIIDSDFVNYKKTSLYIAFPYCDFKCGKDICQNEALVKEELLDIDENYIIKLYNDNPLTEALVLGGLEPFESFDDVYNIIKTFRENSKDDVVIYTGFYPYECLDKLERLMEFENIIIKFGRFIPNSPERFDTVLGITLKSNNQHAYYLNQLPAIITALKNTNGYCPCSLEETENTLCSCLSFREQIDGECHCGLFHK